MTSINIGLIIIAILAVSSLPPCSCSKVCKARHVESNGESPAIVCVCDALYCDNFELEWPEISGEIRVITSSLSGLRFNTITVHKFDSQFMKLDHSTVTINVDTSDLRQEILGFGGSLSDSASINIGSLNFPLNESLVRDYFSSDGLRYDFLRIPLGGADFSIRPYTYCDLDDNLEDDFELKHFKLAPEDTNLKIPLIKFARELASQYGHDVRLIGASWSPPTWMKTNRNYVKGKIRGKPNGPYYKAYGKYLIKAIEMYAQYDLKFWGLSVCNEPIHPLAKSVNFNSLMMPPDEQRDFVKFDLGPELEKLRNLTNNQMNVNLFVLDDNLLLAEPYLNVVLSDTDTYRYTDGIAVHWYYNWLVPHQILDSIHRKYPDKMLISSEGSEGWLPSRGPPVVLGSWTRASTYAIDLIKDLRHNVQAWIDWNVALNTYGGPNWANNYVDSLIIVNSTAQEYYKNPGYYVMGHISRFMPRGSRIVSTTIGNNSYNSQLYDDSILTVAAITPSFHLVTVVFNNRARAVDSALSINGKIIGSLNLAGHSITSIITRIDS